jgi:hypothetical protein
MYLKKLKKIQVCKLKETQFHKMMKTNKQIGNIAFSKEKVEVTIGLPCDSF